MIVSVTIVLQHQLLLGYSVSDCCATESVTVVLQNQWLLCYRISNCCATQSVTVVLQNQWLLCYTISDCCATQSVTSLAVGRTMSLYETGLSCCCWLTGCWHQTPSSAAPLSNTHKGRHRTLRGIHPHRQSEWLWVLMGDYVNGWICVNERVNVCKWTGEFL